MRLERSEQSLADIENLARHISADSIDNALAVVDRIESALERLERLPRMGRPGALSGTRELAIARTPYLAVYRLEAERVVILRVLHGAQAWPPSER